MNELFTSLYKKRHELYFAYNSSLTAFNLTPYIKILAQFAGEITQGEYDFSKLEDINRAISKLEKYRTSKSRVLTQFALYGADYKREFSAIQGALKGIYIAEYARSGEMYDDFSEVVEALNSENHVDHRVVINLKIAEADLTKTLYEISHERYTIESMCKIAKNLCRRLHRLEASIKARSVL